MSVVAVGKHKYYIYQECVSVALVIQHAKHILHGILLHEACLSLPYFFTLSYKWHEKVTEHGMCVLICSADLSTLYNSARYCHKCIQLFM